MNFNEVLIAVGVVCGISVIVGIALGVAERIFGVAVDERETLIREALPGSNCGGCGYAGCDSLAKAIAAGEAPVSACPVGRQPVAEKIAEIMGQEIAGIERKVAFVKCDGTSDKRKEDFNYFGIDSCVYANIVPGSSHYTCKFGCLGYGSCASVCDHSAISIVNKKAVVDESLCVACGKCLKVCPNHLIELVPASSKYRVQCASKAKGADVRNACSAGCISCGICVKNCPGGAITIENNIAKIDYGKCINCGICAEKCPRKIIREYN